MILLASRLNFLFYIYANDLFNNYFPVLLFCDFEKREYVERLLEHELTFELLNINDFAIYIYIFSFLMIINYIYMCVF